MPYIILILRTLLCCIIEFGDESVRVIVNHFKETILFGPVTMEGMEGKIGIFIISWYSKTFES